MDMDDDMNGRVTVVSTKEVKTNRGIKVGSTLSTVKSVYGSAAKKKFKTNESFNKYIKQYYSRYGISSVSSWKNYVEYTYKKGTENDRRLRFYLNKNDKVTYIIYIYQYSKFKLSKKTVDIGFSFEAPSGKEITTKTIAGKEVQLLPENTVISFDSSKLPDFGILADIELYDTKGKKCGETLTPISFNMNSYASGTEIATIIENGMAKRNAKTGQYEGEIDVKKLGKYNYFKLWIYDVNYTGGYDKPAAYYFKL